MHVIFLSRLFYPHIGGVETHVEELSLELIKRGYKITIITEHYDRSLNTRETYKEIDLIRIPRKHLDNKLDLWKYMIKQKDLLSTADLIHAHDVFWWSLPLRILNKTPIYTTFHGWEGHYPVRVKAKAWRWIAEKLSKNTIQVGDFISRWYPTNSPVTIYGATNIPELAPADKNKILFVGRLSRDNDVDLVIHGMKLIKQEIPEIKITFLGDGELAWEAKDVGTVLGFKKNIERYLSQNHWVVASSYLSILDALAAGRSVYSVYSNPLKKDYLESHPAAIGLTISGNPAEFAAKFIGNYKDVSKHSQMVNLAQNWARNQTWAKIADIYEKLWTDKNYKFALEKLELQLNKDN